MRIPYPHAFHGTITPVAFMVQHTEALVEKCRQERRKEKKMNPLLPMFLNMYKERAYTLSTCIKSDQYN